MNTKNDTLDIEGNIYTIDIEDTQEIIRQEKGKWYLYSKDRAKKLGGPYDSRPQAEKREKQVQFFKHQGEADDMNDFALSEENAKEFVRDLVKERIVERALIRKPFWLTLKQMKELCPSCARKMEHFGMTRIKLNHLIEFSDRFIEQGLGKQDPHFFGRCMKHDFGRTFKDKKAFCAWLHKRVVGEWPAES